MRNTLYLLLGIFIFLSNLVQAQEKVESLDSEEAQVRIQKGLTLYQQGQYINASNEAKIVADHFPNYLLAYRLLGLCQLQLKQYEQAADTLNKANQLSLEQEKRNDSTARIARGKALFYAEKYPEAIPELTYTVSQNPNDSSGYYFLGVAHYKLKQEAEAVATLSQAVLINIRDAASWKILAEIYLSRVILNTDDSVNASKAIAAAQKFESLDKTPESANLLGQVYIVTQNFPHAAIEFEKVVAAQPDNGMAYFNLGLSLSRSNQFSKAVESLIKANKLLPDNLNILKELGYSYERMKKFSKAREVYEKAYKLTSNQDEYFLKAIERIKNMK